MNRIDEIQWFSNPQDVPSGRRFFPIACYEGDIRELAQKFRTSLREIDVGGDPNLAMGALIDDIPLMFAASLSGISEAFLVVSDIEKGSLARELAENLFTVVGFKTTRLSPDEPWSVIS